MDTHDFIAIAIVIGFVLGALAGKFATKRDFQNEAIQRGHAQFCPTNGIWAWSGECKNFEVDLSKVTFESEWSE